MSQMTVAQMSITETTASPQHKLQWLSEQALNSLKWPSGAAHLATRDCERHLLTALCQQSAK
jgi:hypothetical protein